MHPARAPVPRRPVHVAAVRDAVERLRGAAWIDVEWQDVSRAAVPLVRKMVVRGAIEEDVEAALAAVVAMVARRALQVCADRAARRSAPC